MFAHRLREKYQVSNMAYHLPWASRSKQRHMEWKCHEFGRVVPIMEDKVKTLRSMGVAAAYARQDSDTADKNAVGKYFFTDL